MTIVVVPFKVRLAGVNNVFALGPVMEPPRLN